MIEELFQDLRTATEKTQEALRGQLGKLRTGRAHPGMLDAVKVDYYGSKTPISQMAAIGVPEPRMLTVKPWEKTQVQAIDKAIRESDLGLNPQLDGDLIRVPVPALSEDRRKDLSKLAKKHGEECKIGIRKARHDAIDLLSEMKKSGDASEDEVERAKKKVEEIVSTANQHVDDLVAAKEKEILTV
jgi:ribosome recycling factor